MPKKQKSATIKDVAKLAGVSWATASRVISQKGYSSIESQKKVMEAVKTLKYTPNASARSLKSQKTYKLGLLIADIKNPHYAQLVDSILIQAKDLGYHAVLCATDENPEMEREYLEILLEDRVDGIIAVPTGENIELWKETIELGVKMVLVDRKIDKFPEVGAILVDNFDGTYEAISYLIKLGHQRIAFINGPSRITTGRERLLGYCKALEDHNIKIDKDLIIEDTFKNEKSTTRVTQLLSGNKKPSAIFASNNILGEASLRAIKEANLKIPRDLSFLQFDNVHWTSLTTPRTTVVEQPVEQIGKVAVDQLFKRINDVDKDEEGVNTILNTKLIIRESCAPPKMV